MSENTNPSAIEIKQKRAARRDIVIVIGVLVLLGIFALYWVISHSGMEETEDAYVNGNVVQITSQIGGTVTAIHADTTDFVEVGQMMVTLNPVDAELAFERAKADLAAAVRQVRTEFHEVKRLQADLAQKENDVQQAERDLGRRTSLVASGAITREEFSHREDSLRNARAALESTRQSLARQQALVENTTIRTHPDVLRAVTQLRDAFVALARTRLPAPVSGIVTKRNVQVGQHINAGTMLISIVPMDSLWVDANFKESQLSDIRIGQPARLIADMYGGSVVYRGTVVGLDAGTGSAFALLPAQNATGNWIKVTQRVPVRIALDRGEVERNPLRIGLSMHVQVMTADSSGSINRVLSDEPQQYQTRVFADELKAADQQVEQVIQANQGTMEQPSAVRVKG